MAELQLGNIKPAGADNIVVDSKYVKGSYFVCDTYANLTKLNTGDNSGNQAIVKGSLCYCTGNANEEAKFYQYDGTTWNEAKLGGAELGTTEDTAAAGNHNHDDVYLSLDGGILSGDLQVENLSVETDATFGGVLKGSDGLLELRSSNININSTTATKLYSIGQTTIQSDDTILIECAESTNAEYQKVLYANVLNKEIELGNEKCELVFKSNNRPQWKGAGEAYNYNILTELDLEDINDTFEGINTKIGELESAISDNIESDLSSVIERLDNLESGDTSAGKATEAYKATCDGNGDNIVDTYARQETLGDQVYFSFDTTSGTLTITTK